jgi:hypothetical protein
MLQYQNAWIVRTVNTRPIGEPRLARCVRKAVTTTWKGNQSHRRVLFVAVVDMVRQQGYRLVLVNAVQEHTWGMKVSTKRSMMLLVTA